MKWNNNRLSNGFTLIEMIIVITLMFTLTMTGIVGFVGYHRAQTLQSAALDLSTMLATAKSYAQSQVKPQSCGNTQALEGYRVSMTSTSYRLRVECGGTTRAIGRAKVLPAGIRFGTNSPLTISFKVLTGMVTSGTITLQGFGADKKIVIDGIGNIALQE